jgi:hypothetical protein
MIAAASLPQSVTIAMKEDKTSNPIDVSLFAAHAVVPDTTGFANWIQQPGCVWSRNRAISCERWLGSHGALSLKPREKVAPERDPVNEVEPCFPKKRGIYLID